MKKSLLLVLAVAFIATSFANTTVEAPVLKKLNANEIMIPVGKTGQKISLMELSTIKRHDLEIMTGKKMNLFERLAFKKTQKRLKRGINEDGVITDKKINKLHKAYAGETGFHIGGFALGFLLGLIGVIIAYLIKDDYKKNRVKWAWIGWGVWIVLWLLLILPAL